MQAHTGEVSTASIACGVLGMGGNKGAVAVSFSLYRRRIAFVCSHFAAHQVGVWWPQHLPEMTLRVTWLFCSWNLFTGGMPKGLPQL